MLGFNKWKDLKSTNPKIWDIFLLDISFSQSLMFNPIDKQSIIVGVGFYEGVNYIYKKGVRFQPGLLIQLGFKL